VITKSKTKEKSRYQTSYGTREEENVGFSRRLPDLENPSGKDLLE
jgi:hypothetical protein